VKGQRGLATEHPPFGYVVTRTSARETSAPASTSTWSVCVVTGPDVLDPSEGTWTQSYTVGVERGLQAAPESAHVAPAGTVVYVTIPPWPSMRRSTYENEDEDEDEDEDDPSSFGSGMTSVPAVGPSLYPIVPPARPEV
jgi:hypothetical protein